MKEHKLRQKIYHANAVLTGHKDDLNLISQSEKIIEIRGGYQELVESIIAHFQVEQPTLIYPSKSYFVAIIYAKLLERHFGESFHASLRDPDLLFGNDKYFLPYGIARTTYDAVVTEVAPLLVKIANGDFEGLPSQVRSTVGYFNEEFQIETQEVLDAPTIK